MPRPAGAPARTRRHGMGVFGPEATCEGPASPRSGSSSAGWARSLTFVGRARRPSGSSLSERHLPIGCGMDAAKPSANSKPSATPKPPRPRPPPDRKGRRAMKSPVVKRSIVIAGHKTSVSLEDAFWRGLKEIANGRDMTLSDLVAAIDSERQHGNLSSAIRLFVLDFYRNQLSDHNEGRDGTRGVLIARAASTA